MRAVLPKFTSQRFAGLMGLYLSPTVSALCIGSNNWPARNSFEIETSLLFLYPFCLVLGSAVGLPILYWLGRLRWVNPWIMLLGGFLGGALLGSLIVLGVGRSDFKALLMLGVGGAVASLVFWIFWSLGPNPDGDNARAWAAEFVRHR